MRHSCSKTWATVDRVPMIHQNVEQKIYQPISDQLREQGCPVRIINGMLDHIHCLFLLNPQKSIADIVKHNSKKISTIKIKL
ncbi:MAG: REP element-mobilizing transposase RayT [Roseivirga sp.]|jgi:putative transposase